MDSYYKPKGCPVHGTTQLSDSNIKVPKLGIEIERYKRIAKDIKPDDLISKELFVETNDMVQKGVEQVWGKPAYTDKQFVFTQRLKRNVAKYAAYKTAAQTKMLQKAKEKDYASINNKFNNVWLRTEYVHTVRSARSAKNWQRYKADADIYPYLEYMPSASATPRSEHRRLYGVIKHIDDAFWSTWLPPSDWGCKCSVQQRRSDKGTNPVPEDIVLPPKQMRNNPGESGEIFTDKHPMIAAVSKTRAKLIDKQYQYLERKSLRDKYMGIAGTTIENILISNRGVKKMLNSAEINEWTILNDFKSIYNQSEKAATRLPLKKLRRNIKYVHYYKIKGIDKNVYLLIWETTDSNLIFHTIAYTISGDKIK